MTQACDWGRVEHDERMKIPQVRSWTALLGFVLLIFVSTVHAKPTVEDLIMSGFVDLIRSVLLEMAGALPSSIVFFPLTWLLFGGLRSTISNGWILAGLAGTTFVVACVFAVVPKKAGEFPEGLLIPIVTSTFFCLVLRTIARKRFDRSALGEMDSPLGSELDIVAQRCRETAQQGKLFLGARVAFIVQRYREKALQGDAAAQLQLGNAYAKGSGLPKNEVEAVKWYRQAAEQGNAAGQFSLGVMYFNGYGVIKDPLEAYKWWLLGATGGNDAAREAIEVVEKQLTTDQRAEGQKMAREANEQLQKNRTSP